MMGIACECHVLAHGHNQSILRNARVPESTLKKKSQSVACHLVREGFTWDEWRIAYVNTN